MIEDHPKRIRAIATLLYRAGTLSSAKDEPSVKQIRAFEGIGYKSIIRPLVTRERDEDPSLSYDYFACKWGVSVRTIRYILNKS